MCELSFYLALLDKITDFPLANMLFVANIRGFLVFRGEYPSCAKTLTGFTCFKLIYHMALTLEILELFFDRNICVCVFDRNHTFETDEVWIDLQINRKNFFVTKNL